MNEVMSWEDWLKGRRWRRELGNRVAPEVIQRLPLAGISGIGNLLASIKLARYYELTENDVVFTILTDSVELYGSRLEELTKSEGAFDRDAAVAAWAGSLAGQRADNLLELSHPEKRRIHNLKYYTWIEQQGKDIRDLEAQWDQEEYWTGIQKQAPRIDELIEEFNREAGTTA